MNMYILIALLTGTTPAQLGEYGSYQNCQNAIRQIYMARIAPDARDGVSVRLAIDTTMQYQQDYQCVPKYRIVK